MTKEITLAFGLFLATTTLSGQAKRYALMEHFTNTLCQTCAIANPSMFSGLQVETNTDLHHISYHWRTPYPNCLYYQGNPVPQDARADYYSISGSPRVSLNGGREIGLTYLTPPIIQDAATTSPIYVKVSETTNANLMRTATIKVKSVSAVPTGNFKLYAAVVEKKTNYASPNGEREHHNVFRRFLTATSGDNITLTSSEQSTFLNYTPDLGATGQLYVVAWVQNTNTKEVLNSGTRFDGLSATDETAINDQITISPNPTTEKVHLTFDKLIPQYLTLQNIAGQAVEHVKLSNSMNYELNMAHLASGIYVLKIKTAEGIAIKRVVKN
jgi:Outer membrane protein Omp28/Secretion system C-terminal sorting domain